MKRQLFKVGLVQLNYHKSVYSIVKDIKKYMKIAKGKGVDILCFPESSLDLGHKKNRALIKELQEDCRKNSIWCILVGHLLEKKYVSNSAFLIDSKGRIAGRHRKVHPCESHPIKKGTVFEVYDTPFCKIGLAICWDVTFPDAIYEMAKKGVDLVFCPMYWVYDEWAHKKDHLKHERKILESLILARAYENIVYVAFCNAYDSSDKTLVSYSAIAEPHKILGEIFAKEGLITATVDLNYLSMIRGKYRREYNKKFWGAKHL
jgi:predicted amidohydrolase